MGFDGPTSLGYATISGVPVQYGLYATAVELHLSKHPLDSHDGMDEPDSYNLASREIKHRFI